MWISENILIPELTSTATGSNPLSEQKVEILLYRQIRKGWFFLQTFLLHRSPQSSLTKKTSTLANSGAQQEWPRTAKQLGQSTFHPCNTCFKTLYFVLLQKFCPFFEYLPLFSFIIRKVQREASLSWHFWSAVLIWTKILTEMLPKPI